MALGPFRHPDNDGTGHRCHPLPHIIHSAETTQSQNATEIETGKVYTMAGRGGFRDTGNGSTYVPRVKHKWRDEILNPSCPPGHIPIEGVRSCPHTSSTLVMRDDKNTPSCLLAPPLHFPSTVKVMSRPGSKVWFSKSSLCQPHARLTRLSHGRIVRLRQVNGGPCP